ncbi:stress responsive A/B barrel domain-containing protein [Myriangium duriaei CBS 260.36]|uniref:Stress responsive A/B barrel domain-containing protein n=1 Tax=Myriangium duriaei CBS 260.36 TaxID=1168546 RepID=A0A9P4J4U5_9PEZI|nr:stress responsive A/B barrel domain-containing protein [Myriangium duriaei CBS 260.36]
MAHNQQVHRVTYFKIEDESAKDKLLGLYKTMRSDALKDGKQYILSAEAGKIIPDPRNGGFTIAAKTTFASMEDFEFYDKECSAHKNLKSYAASVHQGVMMVYFQSAI